ncbi:MAG: hypothetical protein V1784_11405 [bacterium]
MKGAEGTMSDTRVYPVDLILTHYATHDDELDGIDACRWFGHEKLPGSGSAPVRRIDAGLHPEVGRDGMYYLVKKRTACIGVNGGPMDEHPDGDARCSAFAKVVEFIGISHMPELQPMLAYALAADKDCRNGPFEKAPLVKAMWLAGFQLQQVLRLHELAFWGLFHSGEPSKTEVPVDGFRAVVGDFVEHLFSGRCTCRFSSGTEASEFFGRGVYGNGADGNGPDVGISEILKFERREHLSPFEKKTPFDLESIWEAIVRAGKPHEAREFVLACLHAMHVKQSMFLAARAEFSARGTYSDPTVDQPYVVAFIDSDNEEMKHAVSNLGIADVLHQERSTRRFNIFVLRQCVDMSPVVARLRCAEWEIKPDRGPYPSPESLYRHGTIREVPQIFSFYGAHNGTLTAPNTPTSQIPLERRRQCLQDGLRKAYQLDHTPSLAQLKLIVNERRARKAAEKAAKEAAAAASEVV